MTIRAVITDWFARTWPDDQPDVNLWANVLGPVTAAALDDAFRLWHTENAAAPRPADIAGTLHRLRVRAAELEQRRRADIARRRATAEIRARLKASREAPRPWELGLNRPTIESEAS